MPHPHSGVFAAVPTPFDGTFAPIQDLFLEHARWALENGCDGLNILGSTGEANSLDTAARKTVMGWAADALPSDKLMVGTGTPSLPETIALTECADDLGYPAALVLPPYYYKPVTEAGLTEWYLALDRALGDRAIEVYFYNFPQMTGVALSVDVITGLANRAPRRFTGIKDSSGDLDYARAIVAAAPGLKVFPSSETVLETAIRDGFAGCISASVNITAPLAGRIWERRSAPPDDLCNTLSQARMALAGRTLIAGIKALLAQRTGAADWARVLPPFTALPEGAAQALSEALAG